MASTGKKGKKNKGKTLPLTEFLGKTKKSWSDEVEEAERLIEFNRKPALPAAPRAARAINESLIPKNPPYIAYLSNLSFEVDEKDISDCFIDLSIANVRLPREEHTDRIKGFGYVEFSDKLSFVNALHMYEVTIKGRRVRIDIADQEGDRRRGGPKGNRDRESNYEQERSSSDWRAGPRSDYLSNDKRGSSNRRDYSFRDREGFRDKDGFRDRDRDRDRDGPDRGKSFGERETNWRDSERRFTAEREYRSSFSNRRNYDDRNEEPKTRPKLILNPRTLPVEEIVVKEDPYMKKPPAASIFGQAKPVDTAARERQIEERLDKERELVKNEDNQSKTRNDDYIESKKYEPVRENKETPLHKSSDRIDRVDSSSQEIKNGQVSDVEDAPSNEDHDRDLSRDYSMVEESEEVECKKTDENENDKNSEEDRYGRRNRSESRYNERSRENERSYRRDEKYRFDDRERKDKDRKEYDRRDRGHDSDGKTRDSAKYGDKERERDRDRDRERESDRRYNDRDIDNRRHSEKESESKKYATDREGDSKRYQERDGGRHKEPDDQGSNKRSDKRGSASGDRGTRQVRGPTEKDRAPTAKDRPKETKKPDDAPRMPKYKEAAAPNYVGTNKYCCLQEDGASE